MNKEEAEVLHGLIKEAGLYSKFYQTSEYMMIYNSRDIGDKTNIGMVAIDFKDTMRMHKYDIGIMTYNRWTKEDIDLADPNVIERIKTFFENPITYDEYITEISKIEFRR